NLQHAADIFTDARVGDSVLDFVGGAGAARFAITRQFPLEREFWLRNGFIHFAACVTLTVGHRLVYLALCRLLYVDAYRNIPTLLDLYSSDLFFNLPAGFMSYATFLLVGNVIHFYSRSAQPELQPLKAPLQPHFLFNTLNYIVALQLTPDDADNRVAALPEDFLPLTLAA